ERINIELSIKNKLQLLAELDSFFVKGNLPLGKSDDAEGDDIPAAEMLEDRVHQAESLLEQTHARWSYLLANLDKPLGEAKGELAALG
ncbi:hypothetical protein ACMWP9_33295, partial [Escherichia coli]